MKLYGPSALERAMKIAGYRRYMMGSDFPLAPPAMYVAQVQSMQIPDSWKQAVLGGNARRIFGEPSLAAEPHNRDFQPSVPSGAVRSAETKFGVFSTAFLRMKDSRSSGLVSLNAPFLLLQPGVRIEVTM